MIADYFEFLKRIADKDTSVKKIRLIREFIGVEGGFIRFVIELRDGSELHAFHVHEGEDIKPSEEPTFVEILKKIGKII